MKKEFKSLTLFTGLLFLLFQQIPGSTGQNTPTPPAGMVYIPAGSFIMGSTIGDRDEFPQHTAATNEYFIDIYEVTNEQFRQFSPNWPVTEQNRRRPALVTWEQANTYAKWAGKRLPTEAEWEKAARGTDGRLYPWGNYFELAMVAWDNSEPVGSNLMCISPYGCYDMAGNVWEWTADWYKPYAGNDVPCEAYGEKFKVIRGGAAFNDISFNRCSKRYYISPTTKVSGYDIGFRCVMDVEK